MAPALSRIRITWNSTWCSWTEEHQHIIQRLIIIIISFMTMTQQDDDDGDNDYDENNYKVANEEDDCSYSLIIE